MERSDEALMWPMGLKSFSAVQPSVRTGTGRETIAAVVILSLG